MSDAISASTGVLPFVRGVDFSTNDFSGDAFPAAVADMTGLRWLKLNYAEIEKVPEQLSQLKQLEHLHMIGNHLASVHGELSYLPNLRSIIFRRNEVKTSGIPHDVFDMEDLTIVDFAHNQLRDVPAHLDHARATIVLNLAHNTIENIPNQVFTNMTDLIRLDLSSNKLEMLPPQMKRLTDLQVLILNDNPLVHFQLKQLPALSSLRVLHMRNTQRTPANIPSALENLVNLEDVDFSSNELEEIPDALYKLAELRMLNLSSNRISSVQAYSADCWLKLEILNLSRNQLRSLPAFICSQCARLKKLFLNENQLTFDGLPAGLGKLLNLEVFQAAFNQLELVPESLGRCVKLKRIRLNNNRLVTLPGSIHLLPDLQELDVHNNPDLIMPPKPAELKAKEARRAFYNIDFSLEAQMRLAGATVAASSSMSSSLSESPTPGGSKDPLARKIQFLRRRKGQAEADSDQRKILQGFNEVAKERTRAEQALIEERDRLKKRWDEALQKPKIDYSDIFDEYTGQAEGLSIWEIENFLPNPLDEAFYGKFCEADCYIVLRTFINDSHSLDWQIFFWLGEKATLDKKACAAIHAVNLRNFLGATCRTQREEMNDESDEFLDLFDQEAFGYVEGGRTESGFFTVEEVKHIVRLYRVIAPKSASHFHLEPVAVSAESLDPRFVFFLDAGRAMFIWFGRKAGLQARSKARLFAEKINKCERKGLAEIEVVCQTREPPEFWGSLLGANDLRPEDPIVENVPSDFRPADPKLYSVKLGTGFLELPQVYVKRRQLRQEMLESRQVYILDCYTDVFIWIGRRSTRLLKAAGSKLAAELYAMLQRPEYALRHEVHEGTESLLFKMRFIGWDDIVAVDFTRTADSVQRRGVDLNVILERDKIRTDLTALFLDRQAIMPEEEAEELMDECNEDLDHMESFVLEGKKFVRLPSKEFGIFYTSDCYVFLCRYWVPADDSEEQDGKGEGAKGERSTRKKRISATSDEEASMGEEEVEESEKTDGAQEGKDDFQCVVYFWQGRDASNMGWLTFTFSLQKKFESLFKDKLEVVRMYQQQENHKFLSHFRKRFVIRRGRRNLAVFSSPFSVRWPELYQLRANGSALCTRTIQTDAKAECLNSAFVFILKYPLKIPDDDGQMGFSFVWVGSKAEASEARLAEAIAREVLNRDEFPIQIVSEGEEPEIFWEALGGKKAYETEAEFMRFSRLFRCTNEKGYFTVSEKMIDFCQDDLDDEDVMILDNGDQLFIWVGSKASEVEVKLAYKSAQVYIQHLRLKQPDRPRKLFVTMKGKESKRFSKCFHAWSKHKSFE